MRRSIGRNHGSSPPRDAAAGLAFASKQNVGILGLCGRGCFRDACRAGGLVSVAPAREPHGGLRRPVVWTFFPVWSSGGLAGLLDYGFLGKGAYIRAGGVSPLEGLRPGGSSSGRSAGGTLLLACAGSIRYWVIPV